MNRFIAFILVCTSLFFPLTVQASPWKVNLHAFQPPDNNISSVGKISPIKSGQKAPFDGVLLDSAAAARVIVDQQTAEDKCQIEIEKEVGVAKAKLTLDLNNMQASRDALQKELDVRIALKDEHINFLEKEAIKNAKKASNSKWWLVGGVITGIALTIGGAFIVREIRGDQPIVINSGGN